ncbi:MAG: hypothetical protein A3B23_03435 [Candidatus Colwellbacteria bacterium RIFCSPLOWO2_01_FULL_48_10]|uniref:Prepilin type IV endopeptidase peptidase domain-containing protein n=2 Tax=Bacteria candidate phyla TaxID=1783234 RepID=A0A1F5P284_9BACT|nr:MAG: hypothetical protein A2846_00805 [Candidatus Doudnabacteria bacterium RIFCSPHIGHO2_01_FULL_49_9]OGY59694.1 MAG: hypothetical protein A3B23_03435 [Candidatus Colwellbacteria bacterium RIFCSPLOWO2_01_FULL_48_10]
MIDFFIGPFLVWFPRVAVYAFFVGAVLAHLNRYGSKTDWLKVISYKSLVISAVAFRLLNVLMLSAAQYYVWAQSKFTQILLDSPIDTTVPQEGIVGLFPGLFQTKLGYFFLYSWGRFWINLILIFLVAYGFWAFLKLLKKHKERFFDTGEVELGFLMSLLVGWPNFVIFIPAVFLSVILVSIFRGIFLKEPYTTLGWPFIVAGAIAIVFGNYFITALNLGVLRI